MTSDALGVDGGAGEREDTPPDRLRSGPSELLEYDRTCQRLERAAFGRLHHRVAGGGAQCVNLRVQGREV